MKELGPVRKRFFGNVTGAHVNVARKILGAMKQQMKYGNLHQLARQVVYDGVIYRVESLYGQDVINITAPEYGGDPVTESLLRRVIEITGNNFIQILYYSREKYRFGDFVSFNSFIQGGNFQNWLEVGNFFFDYNGGFNAKIRTVEKHHNFVLSAPITWGKTAIYPRFFFIEGFKKGPTHTLIPNDIKGLPTDVRGNSFVNFGEFGASFDAINQRSLPNYAPILTREQWYYEGFGDPSLYSTIPLNDFVPKGTSVVEYFRDFLSSQGVYVNWPLLMVEALKTIFGLPDARGDGNYPIGVKRHLILDCLDGYIPKTPSFFSCRSSSPSFRRWHDRIVSESFDFENTVRKTWDDCNISNSYWYSSCFNDDTGVGLSLLPPEAAEADDLNDKGDGTTPESEDPVDICKRFGGEYFRGEGGIMETTPTSLRNVGQEISEKIFANILAEGVALQGDGIVEKDYEVKEVRNG